MGEIHSEEANKKSTIAKKVAAGLATAVTITSLAACDYSPSNKGTIPAQKSEGIADRVRDIERERMRDEERRKIIDSGNPLIDQICQDTIDRKTEAAGVVQVEMIKTLASQDYLKPGEICFLDCGESYLEGKIKMVMVNTQTGEVFPINQVLDYQAVNDQPLFVYSKINRESGNPQAVYQIGFLNDGEHDVKNLGNIGENSILSLVREKTKAGLTGSYNEINLGVIKATAEVGNYTYTQDLPGNIISYHFLSGGEIRAESLKGNDDEAGLALNLQLKINNLSK
ncbi:MAG TPA: hypothetical protein PK131_02490 [Candidatus Woesebacteria bacterium]|nr:hypothetical protein [Candidatus Woesebacteria bacterium]HRT39864.1 hypothetical protein [Candidatus Woesebacteria bacterium]